MFTSRGLVIGLAINARRELDTNDTRIGGID
jgi:hypothetical protein